MGGCFKLKRMNPDDTIRKMHSPARMIRDDLLNLMVKNIGNIVYCFNIQTLHFEFVNPSIAEVLGMTAEEIIAMEIDQLISRIHPDHIAIVEQKQKMAEEKGQAQADYLFLNKKGEYRWISDWMSVIKDKKGMPLYRFGCSRDITDFKRSEADLKESESRFRTIVEAANEGIWQVNSKLSTIYVNGKMASMLGYTEMELMNRSVLDFLEKRTVSEILKSYKNKKYRIEGSYENKFLRKDGTHLAASTNVSMLNDASGNLAGYIGMVTDISARKKMEEAYRKTQKKLDMALDNGNIGIWEWDLIKDEVIWDERTEKMFGLDPGTFGKTHGDFEALVHEEDIPYLKKAFRETMEKDLPYEVVFRKKSDCGYISSKGQLVRNRKGKPVMMTGVSFDVTDMKRGAEQSLIRLTEELTRSNQELQQFAYVASHDLQEPLRMVSSFTQLLQKRYYDKLDQDANDFIRYAVEGSRRMYEMINSLLIYSRVKTKAREFTPVNMNVVLQHVKDNLSLVITETKAVISGGDLPEIFADENQMIELLQNLIGNSIKFSKDIPKITIGAESRSDRLIFYVKDEGIGIDPIYSERIFRIFQRLHAKGEYGGTGIGLAVCKRIVERHHGNIWLQSELGKGCTFYFSLPRK